MPFFSQRVDESFEGNERLDKYISSLPNGLNRSKLKSGVTEILVNNKNAKLSTKVRAGDQIEIQWDDNIPDNIEPENIPLKIIFENDDVTVVNKEQGMVTHPAAGNWSGTLVNALLYHWGMSSIEKIKDGDNPENLKRRRPGIVHRLDKDTSGVIITAKNREAEEWLGEQFMKGKVQKEYLAIVRGCPAKRCGIVDTLIVRDGADRKRFKAFDEDALLKRRTQRFGEDVDRYFEQQGEDEQQNFGKRAVTLYNVLAVYQNYSLVRVRLLTGRTHQIRVHMKYLGCPVLGDPIYSKKDNDFPNATLMLHSRILRIALPHKEGVSVFKAAAPEHFVKIVSLLHKKYPRAHLPKNTLTLNELAANFNKDIFKGGEQDV